MHAVHSQVASHFPSPMDYQQDIGSTAPEKLEYGHFPPPISNVSVRILPEVKILTNDNPQTLWVSVEIEGSLHNRRTLVDSGLDIIIIIDNG